MIVTVPLLKCDICGALEATDDPLDTEGVSVGGVLSYATGCGTDDLFICLRCSKRPLNELIRTADSSRRERENQAMEAQWEKERLAVLEMVPSWYRRPKGTKAHFLVKGKPVCGAQFPVSRIIDVVEDEVTIRCARCESKP